ncbi:hypothetical protein AB0J89_27355 [Micromonospora chokoriensis]
MPAITDAATQAGSVAGTAAPYDRRDVPGLGEGVAGREARNPNTSPAATSRVRSSRENLR